MRRLARRRRDQTRGYPTLHADESPVSPAALIPVAPVLALMLGEIYAGTGKILVPCGVGQLPPCSGRALRDLSLLLLSPVGVDLVVGDSLVVGAEEDEAVRWGLDMIAPSVAPVCASLAGLYGACRQDKWVGLEGIGCTTTMEIWRNDAVMGM